VGIPASKGEPMANAARGRVDAQAVYSLGHNESGSSRLQRQAETAAIWSKPASWCKMLSERSWAAAVPLLGATRGDRPRGR